MLDDFGQFVPVPGVPVLQRDEDAAELARHVLGRRQHVRKLMAQMATQTR